MDFTYGSKVPFCMPSFTHSLDRVSVAITTRWEHWSLMKSCLSSFMMRYFSLTQNEAFFNYCRIEDNVECYF